MDRMPAELWEAGRKAILNDSAWPLSVYWYAQTGADRFVSRTITDEGFIVDYKQKDVLVDRNEWLKASNPGRIVIRETQEFPNRHRDGGFPYDTAIVTAADAVEFGKRF